MNHEDAKFILHAYRPDGSDAGDAAFEAAIKLTREDAGLARWFERQQAFDRAIAAKLCAIVPPAELRDSILAGGRVSGRPRAAWWRRPGGLALAASAAVLLTASFLLLPRRAAANAALFAYVANDALHPELHGGAGKPAAALQATLSQPTTRLGKGISVNFDALRSTGCRSLDFQGHEVLEVCFKRNGSWFHCYVVRRADFPSLAALARPAITELNNVEVASWADSTDIYLVAGDVGREALRRLL